MTTQKQLWQWGKVRLPQRPPAQVHTTATYHQKLHAQGQDPTEESLTGKGHEGQPGFPSQGSAAGWLFLLQVWFSGEC